MKVTHAERVPGAHDQWRITLVPVAAQEIEVWAEFRRLRNDHPAIGVRADI